MINDLNYAVTFPINGVSLSGRHTFQPGTTAVSGRNGSGKSFGYSEVIRYGLFGKKALRGPASDYKKLEMAMTFTAAGAQYQVARGKKQLVTDADGETLAVGAEAVDKKIVEILGFGLEVFDVVCAANQKESERLTRLTPAKRKELIDDVVGLTAQETVEKACRDEAAGFRREAEALSRALVIPEEPTMPAGYRLSDLVEVELNETKALVEKRGGLQRVIDAVGLMPAAPTEPQVNVELLEHHEHQRIEQEANRAALQRQLASIPTTEWTTEELDAAEALNEHLAEVKRRGPEPTITIAELNAAEAVAEYEAEVTRRGPEPTRTMAELDEMSAAWAKISALDDMKAEVECPACEHRFSPAQTQPTEPELSPHQVMKERVAHHAWETPLVRPEGEALPAATIAKERKAHAAWETPLVRPDGHQLPSDHISKGRIALAQANTRDAIVKELDEMVELSDKAADLSKGRVINQRWAIHANELDAYNARFEASVNAAIALEELAEPKASVDELAQAHLVAVIYETQLESYANQKERFEQLTADIADKQARADGFAAGAKGLVEARRTLKAFLAPSLSRVATTLIQQMTVNSDKPITTIEVDEDMHITADGQDVGTFNGAHATMINLALRFALGQVLVARVFPIFIGDEIDSDADASNSQAVADALGALSEQLKQVILISHKRLENVDHEVVL